MSRNTARLHFTGVMLRVFKKQATLQKKHATKHHSMATTSSLVSHYFPSKVFVDYFVMFIYKSNLTNHKWSAQTACMSKSIWCYENMKWFFSLILKKATGNWQG